MRPDELVEESVLEYVHLVELECLDQPYRAVADISDLKGGIAIKLSLYAERPRLDIRRAEVGIEIPHLNAYGRRSGK